MVAYEFYFRDERGKEHLIGILPERRAKPERITNDAILRWGRNMIGDHTDIKDVHFVPLKMYGPKK
jgi:hypothetical protein